MLNFQLLVALLNFGEFLSTVVLKWFLQKFPCLPMNTCRVCVGGVDGVGCVGVGVWMCLSRSVFVCLLEGTM